MLQDKLEKAQNRAVKFVTRNCNFENEITTKLLKHLKKETLKQRRKSGRLI